MDGVYLLHQPFRRKYSSFLLLNSEIPLTFQLNNSGIFSKIFSKIVFLVKFFEQECISDDVVIKLIKIGTSFLQWILHKITPRAIGRWYNRFNTFTVV